MLYCDEARERDLRGAKIYAPVNNNRQDANISESLNHELHENFLRKKKKIPLPKFAPLSIGTLFWRLASLLLPMRCGKQSSNACCST